MPFLKEQIGIVNSALLNSSLNEERFQGARIERLAWLANVQSNERIHTMPVLIDKFAEMKYVGIDDTFPLTIYHRMLSNAYPKPTAKDAGGDTFRKKTQVTDMVMVVSGRANIIKLTSEQLEALIANAFPDIIPAADLTDLKLDSMTVTLLGSDMNNLNVFNTEYRNIDFVPPEDLLLFSMRYQIEISWKKGCFKLCDCD